MLVIGALGFESAQAQRVVPSLPLRQGTLSFDGKATVGDFTGTTTTVTGQLTGGPLAQVRGWVEAQVATLKTANDHRDRDLNKSMDTEKFPTMRFDLEEVREEAEHGDSADVVLGGKFTIHGVTRPAQLNARIYFQGEDVRVVTTAPLNLKDYQISGLSKFLGVLKMHPDIVIHVDLTFGH
jgi:polyisoprenoid-binding protein YceI